MAEVTQTILHGDPQGRQGNCLQAAVASLLDLPLDDVPHFVEADDWTACLVDWAAEQGWLARYARPDAPVALGIACGPSPRGVHHAVVMRDGVVVWDPHRSRDGLVKIGMIVEFSRIGAA
ncbi:hypothetical protein [Streptacidiphilus cavernicola]|uniref:NlpC/P60 domain-containing protein n=1 Tax=Streptacidiphilus cavernicola TaxID=3342716 RepID=A0ABV6VYK8_9ACTN